MCSRSPYKINDFLKWDFIGAPHDVHGVTTVKHMSYNGGFSLRRKSKQLEMIAKCPFNSTWWGSFRTDWFYEDLWYARCWEQLALEDKLHLRLPPRETAELFSIQDNYHPWQKPMAVHKPWRLRLWAEWSPNLPLLLEYCPDICNILSSFPSATSYSLPVYVCERLIKTPVTRSAVLQRRKVAYNAKRILLLEKTS